MNLEQEEGQIIDGEFTCARLCAKLLLIQKLIDLHTTFVSYSYHHSKMEVKAQKA